MSSSLLGRKILVVEDLEENQFLIGHYLKIAGASVELACNGHEALGKVHESEFDAILMDIQMPQMDGFEATAQLRERGCTLPILALTALGHEEDRKRCLKAGFDDHLTKPIDRLRLIDRLRDFLA